MQKRSHQGDRDEREEQGGGKLSASTTEREKRIETPGPGRGRDAGVTRGKRVRRLGYQGGSPNSIARNVERGS